MMFVDKRQSGKKVKASPSPTPVQSPVGTAGALNGGTGYGKFISTTCWYLIMSV